MDDGLSFDAGDRQMTVVRPPLYDSPTTRGLFDRKTGVYWAVDSFATPVPGGEGAEQLAGDVSELDDEFWTHGMTMFAFNALAPWLRLVDPERFSTEVGRLSELQISTIISAHSPAITGSNVQDVLQKTRSLPEADSPPLLTKLSLTSSWRRRKGPNARRPRSASHIAYWRRASLSTIAKAKGGFENIAITSRPSPPRCCRKYDVSFVDWVLLPSVSFPRQTSTFEPLAELGGRRNQFSRCLEWSGSGSPIP